MLCLEGMHGGTHDGLIAGLEIGLPAEDDIGCELYLHEAPVVSTVKVAHDGAEVLGPSVQTPMQAFGIEAIGKRLSLFRIADGQEGIISPLKGDPCLGQSLGQPVMAVQVDLQAKRHPGGYSDITEPEYLIDEIEVIVQTLPRGRLQTGSMLELVMPGAIRRTGLHRREDMHQPRMFSPCSQDPLDPLLFCETPCNGG